MLAPPATHTPSKLRRRSSDDGDTLRLLQNRDRLLAVLQGVLGSDASTGGLPAPSALPPPRDRAASGGAADLAPLSPLASNAVTRSWWRAARSTSATLLDGSAPPAVRAAAARAVELLAKGSVSSRRAARAHCRRRCRAPRPPRRALAADGADDGAALAAFLGATRALVELGASDAQTRAYLGEKRQEASDAVDALREVEGAQLAELHEASRLRPGAADDADAAAKVLELEQSVAATQAELVDAVAAARACAGLPQLVISLIGGAAALLALCSPRRKLGSSVSVLTPMKSQRPGGGMPERRNSGDFLAEPAADLQSTAAAGRALLCAVCAESSSLALVLDALTAALLAAREGAARAAAAATAVVALNALSDAKVLLRHMTRGRTGPWLAPALTVLGAAVRAAENDPLTAHAAADVPPPLHLDPRLVVAMARELGSRKIDQLETRGDHEEARALERRRRRGRGDEEGGAPRVAALGLVLHATVRMRLLAQRRAVQARRPTRRRCTQDPRPAPRDDRRRAPRGARHLGAEVMRVAPSLGGGAAVGRRRHRAWCPCCCNGRSSRASGRVPVELGPLRGGAARARARRAAARPARAHRLSGLGALGRRRPPRRRRRHRRGSSSTSTRSSPSTSSRGGRPRPSATRGRRPTATALPQGARPRLRRRGDARRAGAARRRRGRAVPAARHGRRRPARARQLAATAPAKLDFAKLVKEQQAQQARARSQSGGGTAKGKGAGRWGDMTSRREGEGGGGGARRGDGARAAPPGPDDALLQAAHAAKRGDWGAARRHFRAAFDLSRKPEAAISAANMAAKNGEVQAALDEYDELLRGGGAGALSSVHRSFVIRKRAQVETDAGIAQE